ncbi:MAG: 16S rRNA (cytidine(1402)-2'-O)-methyltransferase [bacterium]
MKKYNSELGILYVVATPIGNMEDITLRALRVLKEVSLVLCEDTRHTRLLLNRHEIKTKTDSYHAHSNDSKLSQIARKLEEGENLALVSDAGTPLVSDPGVFLISYLREKFGNDLKIVPIPGASALTAALSVIPVSEGRFTFIGFLPHKKGRQTIIKEMIESQYATVCYESSHRILKLLAELEEFFPEAHVWIARELTKQFEEVLEGKPQELSQLLTEKPEKQKGEFVVIVSKKTN